MLDQYRAEFDRMRELVDELPTFVPTEHIQQELIQGTIYVTILNTAFFVVCVFIMHKKYASKKATLTKDDKTTIYETSYLITTATFNLILGIMGAYLYITVMEHPGDVDVWILGYRAMYPLSCIQLAKNLFAVPVGLTLIHEKVEMLYHHVCVLFVVCVAASFTAGFTYFSPIVFGLLEISSVPLALMSYFKYNPELIQTYPNAYSGIRLVFGISFLVVRWGLSLPNLVVMLRLIFFRCITFYQDGMWLYMAIMSFTFVATFFLTFLQVYWGALILKSLIKGKPKSKAKKEE